MDLKELLKEKINEADRLIRKIEEMLRNTSVETFFVRKEKGMYRYYKYNSKDGKKTYLGADKTGEIRALENKGYWKKLKKCAEREKECLEEIGRKLDVMPHWHEVFYGIREEKRHLIAPIVKSPDCFSERDLQIWKMNRFKNRNDRPTANVTMNGENVKSKSELIIADRLRNAGVPYHYESDKLITDEFKGRYMKWHPDFRVLNQRTGREYWWEHFGRMGDPEYFASCMYKLETYARNGLYLGDNLIITMESDSVTLGTDYIDLLIERFFK